MWWEEPAPEVPTVMVPGLALAFSTSSSKVVMPESLRTQMKDGDAETWQMGAKLSSV